MPANSSPPAPAAPVKLSAIKKSHVLRLGLKGRKGRWVGQLVTAEPQAQQLTIKVKWMAEPRTVSFADIVSAEARGAGSASKFVAVELDA